MYQSNYEPTAIGAAITTGNIGKLAEAAAEARAIFARQAATLAEIERRIERLERQRADEIAAAARVSQ
jgi:hypothetical protein